MHAQLVGGETRHWHRHGAFVHEHAEHGPHRHLLRWRSSAAVGAHPHGHGHSHGLIDPSIKRSREGLRAVGLSLLILAVAAVAQLLLFFLTGSVALLATLATLPRPSRSGSPSRCGRQGPSAERASRSCWRSSRAPAWPAPRRSIG